MRQDNHTTPPDENGLASEAGRADSVPESLDSPVLFALWIAGLFGVGACAFVLSALVSAH